MIKIYIRELEDGGLVTTQYASTAAGIKRHIFVNLPGLYDRYLIKKDAKKPISNGSVKTTSSIVHDKPRLPNDGRAK